MKRSLALALVMGLLVGCLPFKPEQRSQDDLLQPPASFSSYGPGQVIPERWWRALDSLELNRLVNRALSDNFDIRSAWARLRQARAQAGQAASGLFPSLQGSAEAQKKNQYSKKTQATTKGEKTSYGLSASYELDLWGRVRSKRQAQLLSAEAARKDVESAAVSVVGEIASTWVDTLALRREIALLRTEVSAQRHLLQLQRRRFERGLIDGPTLTQQRRQLSNAQAKLPDLQTELGQARNSLASLVGAPSPDGLVLKQRQLPVLIPYPKTGLPASLLAERPDIQAAWLELRSADWGVAEAKADMLPSLSLSAGRTYSNDLFGLDWSSWVSELTGSLTAPLFTGGQRLAEVERTQAVVEQRVAEYGAVVLEALRDVHDALVKERWQRLDFRQVRRQLRASELELKQARLRYAKGQGAYVDLVAEQVNVAQFKRLLLQARSAWSNARIGLYRALGNDWTEALKASSRDQ